MPNTIYIKTCLYLRSNSEHDNVFIYKLYYSSGLINILLQDAKILEYKNSIGMPSDLKVSIS